MADIVRRHTHANVAASPLAPPLRHVVDLDLSGLAWQADAACIGCDTEVFFSDLPTDQRTAKRICGGCPVREQCLQLAHDRREQFGVWGGMGPGNRRRARTAANAARKAS